MPKRPAFLPANPSLKETQEKFQLEFQASILHEGKFINPPPSPHTYTQLVSGTNGRTLF